MPRARTNKKLFTENHNLLVTWPRDGATELIGGTTYLKMRNFFTYWDMDIKRENIFEHFQNYMEHSCNVRTQQFLIFKKFKFSFFLKF